MELLLSIAVNKDVKKDILDLYGVLKIKLLIRSVIHVLLSVNTKGGLFAPVIYSQEYKSSAVKRQIVKGEFRKVVRRTQKLILANAKRIQ